MNPPSTSESLAQTLSFCAISLSWVVFATHQSIHLHLITIKQNDPIDNAKTRLACSNPRPRRKTCGGKREVPGEFKLAGTVDEQAGKAGHSRDPFSYRNFEAGCDRYGKHLLHIEFHSEILRTCDRRSLS